MEHGEDMKECAQREVFEETGLKVRATEVVGWTNDVFEQEKKHYITFFVLCEREDDTEEPQVGLCADPPEEQG